MSTEANKAVARRYFEEYLNVGRGKVGDNLFVSDYRCHFPGFPDPTDRNEHDNLTVKFVGIQEGSFPDGHFIIEDMIAEGDRVMSRYTFHGTYQRPWIFKMAPTGKLLSFTGTEVHRIADGRIVEQWSGFDTLEILQQLGALPPLEMPNS